MPAPENPRRRIRAPKRSASIALLLITCCACAADPPEDRPSDSTRAPSAGTAPKLTSAAHLTLPIESYMFSDDQRRRIVAAKEQVIGACMKRYGLPYEEASQSTSFQPESMTALRYGISSASEGALRGYRPEGSEMTATAEETHTAEPASKKATEVLQGTGKVFEYKNHSVPKDGCIGESRRALHDTEKDGGGGDAEISNGINAASWDYSYKSGEVRAVIKEWSACMKAEGFRYSDPMAANNDPEWKKSETATAKEKQVASADAECKKKYNVVGVWYASDKTYQQRLIAENGKELEAVRQRIRTQLRLAGKILDS